MAGLAFRSCDFAIAHNVSCGLVRSAACANKLVGATVALGLKGALPQCSDTRDLVAKRLSGTALSMRNWATSAFEVKLPIGSQDSCEQGR